MMESAKQLAVVKHARKTATTMCFELRPKPKSTESNVSSDSNGEPVASSSSETVQKPFALDELRNLRSELVSGNDDKTR